jgi:hypothetical protein
VHVNKNGTRDFGLLGINESNFGLLHLTPATALDPCQSIRAAGDLIAILSRYNSGSPTRSIGYGMQVMARLRGGEAPTPIANSRPASTAGDVPEAPADALAEPVKPRKGANAILVFDGWEGD